MIRIKQSDIRSYEKMYDLRVPPGFWLAARIDGRNFTSFTAPEHGVKKPFDPRISQALLKTAEHLLSSGFQVLYAYTQSDEISLLFEPRNLAFGGRTSKMLSILAGETSAKFSLEVQRLACFDCRLSLLPSFEHVLAYFAWRQEDCSRNALNAYCYWILREQGKNGTEATALLKPMNTADKNEFLFQHNINFNEIPLWQKRGIGLYFKIEKTGHHNPQQSEKSKRPTKQLIIEDALPMKDKYIDFLRNLLS